MAALALGSPGSRRCPMGRDYRHDAVDKHLVAGAERGAEQRILRAFTAG